MHGARLAGVLTAVAIGPVLIGFLLLWTWKIFRNHHQDLNQDLEPTRLVAPEDHRCFVRTRVFHQVIFEEDVADAIETVHTHLISLAFYCAKKSKASKTIDLWRLRCHLYELGDGGHRLPQERLAELVPSNVAAFVGHIIMTTVIEAITVSEKSHLTILHPPSVALLTEVLSHGDPDRETWRVGSAHLRECMAYLIPSELSNQKGKNRLIEQLTNLFGEALGPIPDNDEDYYGMLNRLFDAAIKVGTILLRHPVEYRFDWVVGDTQSEKQVVMFPKVVAVTDHLGLPRFRPRVIFDGDILRLK